MARKKRPKPKLVKSYLTYDELSFYCSIPISTLSLGVKQAKIPHLRIGRRILFKVEEIDRWLESFREVAESDLIDIRNVIKNYFRR